MSKRKSAGQRRAQKVLTRRKRARGGGTVCGGAGRLVVDVPEQAAAPVPLRESDALDELLEHQGVRGVSLLIDDAVVAAVARTLVDGSASAGKLLDARLRALDAEYAETADDGEHCPCCDFCPDPDDGPSEWARMRLLGWLFSARRRGVDLGSPEVFGHDVADLVGVASDLVAGAGDGDVGWLLRLDRS